jgi:hypothetical protein
MNLRYFITIQGSPVYADIGPYIAICVNDAHATVNSIYRGPEAAAILHKHGKHSQAELHTMFQRGRGAPANPPGYSTHELRSDGVAYPHVAPGSAVPWWAQGFDVNDADVHRVIAQAAKHGWVMWQPYRSGAEFHHLGFRVQPQRPKLNSRLWARMARIRLTYPRS